MARNVGVSAGSIKNWISILRTSGLIFLLQPYYKNVTKRFTKTPKLYFLDTGLASYLAGWTTSEALRYGISSGNFFETFVISEIIKSYRHNLINPSIYFFRDEKDHEIDLLIQKNGTFYPIEINQHSTPSIKDISAFKIFSKIEKVEYGCEICLTPEPQSLSSQANAISIWNI